MYVTIIIICKTTIYINILFYLATELWDIGRNEGENVHYW